ncbi:hypothetical protein JB92DRAFT_2806819 [Gautieria morchelliformis]|nr:hypothetical protein JB92DRAFT_2806819 [Gautieria morchelliformis]
MRLPGLVVSLVILFLPAQVVSNPSYFVINQPAKGTQWANGQTNYATWTQGLGQGISAFDVELARISTDGLLFVARNVPSSLPSLPITLTDVPAGDDYFLLFINSTHGLMYSMSPRFSILPAGQTASNASSNQPPAANKGQQLLATVTLSGAPNPTNTFAYTFAPTAGARKAWSMGGAGAAIIGVVASLWTIW